MAIICEVCGRESNRSYKGMCYRHYYQLKKHGRVLDTNKRTRQDKNEIIIVEDHAEIVIYDDLCNEKSRIIVDKEDVEKIKKYKWQLSAQGYCVSTKRENNKRHTIFLHCLLMNKSGRFSVVDHINRNTLDNRKHNLRICTQADNCVNKSIRCDSTTGVTGVTWYKKYSKWLARITVNKKRLILGYFDSKEDAIRARKEAEEKYFGEFRPK